MIFTLIQIRKKVKKTPITGAMSIHFAKGLPFRFLGCQTLALFSLFYVNSSIEYFLIGFDLKLRALVLV